MDLWGATAFISALTLAVYDADYTCNILRKYGVVAETNPGVAWFATILGDTGIYVATVLPTLVLITGATLAQSSLGLGIVLGARLCLFRFQLLSRKLQSQMDALKSAQGQGTPPPGSDAPKEPDV
jgi:hypothetical protein